MKQPKGTNNQSGYPLSHSSVTQKANGGSVTTKSIPAAATHAGHKQVNPGSNKK